MGRVRYSVAMSLDGYIAGPNGEHDWIIMDSDIDFGALMSSFDLPFVMLLLRHLLAILLLPFVVVVVVPRWLLTAWAAVDTRWDAAALLSWLARLVGGVVFVVGLGLFAWCVVLFARVGRGTLAPWDPTRELVTVGPYRYVRNPMISGVAMMLVGQALFWGSLLVAVWAAVFALVNHVYFVASEEPGLERRFGEAYRHYRANVPRWLPRLRPWEGTQAREGR